VLLGFLSHERSAAYTYLSVPPKRKQWLRVALSGSRNFLALLTRPLRLV
jgi:hypothetical protein